jgi:hypothetical protein
VISRRLIGGWTGSSDREDKKFIHNFVEKPLAKWRSRMRYKDIVNIYFMDGQNMLYKLLRLSSVE